MAERIDIYDANLGHLGTMDRIKAHMEGQWHRTFHCWVVSPERDGQVLFQKRSDTMKNYPGLLDVSAAGHLDAGEPVQAGLREVAEELGISVDRSNLHYLGERIEVADQENGQRNREYQSVHLYRCDTALSEYEVEAEEVAALVWLPIESGMKLFIGSEESLTVYGYTFEKSGGNSWDSFKMEITRESFLPRIQPYYLTSLIMAERLLSDAGPLAIS